MPRIRMNIRSMMAIVALASILLGVEVGRRRRAELLMTAGRWSSYERFYDEMAEIKEESVHHRKEDNKTSENRKQILKDSGELNDNLVIMNQLVSKIDKMIRDNVEKARLDSAVASHFRSKAFEARVQASKFRRAAQYPWLPLRSDMYKPINKAVR